MKSNEPTPRNVLVIRKLNDQARRSMQGVVLTRGVAALPPHVLVSALKAIAEFDDFNCKRRSNNPSLKRPDNLVAPE